MHTLKLQLPESVHSYLKEIAQREGLTVDQFISTAVTEKISALKTEDYLAQRAKQARRGALKEVLDRVPDREPLPGDEL